PRIGFLQVFFGRDTPDLRGSGHAVNAAASFRQFVLADSFVMNRKAHGFDESANGAGRIGVGEHDAVDAGCEDLIEHPGVGAYGGRVDAVHRDVDDDGGSAMTAARGAARDEPAHIFLQAFDVVRSVLHVVADVVGVGLRVFFALLEGPGGPGVGAGVVNGL